MVSSGSTVLCAAEMLHHAGVGHQQHPHSLAGSSGYVPARASLLFAHAGSVYACGRITLLNQTLLALPGNTPTAAPPSC
jgi:hypothetical protein